MRKEIEGFPGYFIEDNGSVWSEYSNKFLKPLHDTNGYLMVNLHKDGKQWSKRIHRLVAEAFINNPNNYDQVNHIDENKENNNINNLEWVTQQENNKYIEKIGHHSGRPKKKVLVEFRNGDREEYESLAECAKHFNVNKSTIQSYIKIPLGKKKRKIDANFSFIEEKKA